MADRDDQARRLTEEANRQRIEKLQAREAQIAVNERRLTEARKKFEREKDGLRLTAVREAAGVTVRVIIGVMTGTVSLTNDGHQLKISDAELSDSIDRLELSTLLVTVTRGILTVWERLKTRLSDTELSAEHEQVREALPPAADLGSKGAEP